MNDESEGSWVEVRRFRRRDEAEQHALVLAAMGVDCQLVPEDAAYALRVEASDLAYARRQLAAYERENRRRVVPPSHGLSQGVDGALVYWAVLVFVHAATGRQAFSQDWWAAGRAQAGLIVSGEWWRALTAMGLHADFGHLFANLATGSLFGILLAQMVGAGLAWLAILLAGGLGNVVNALIHPAVHTSVGASTAVFAALGILAALMAKRQAPRGWQGPRRWAPLAAGAMLLVFIGTAGERTDIGAHVAGFVAGCLFGAAIHLGGPYLPQGRRAQYGYGASALALFVIAWLAALRAV